MKTASWRAGFCCILIPIICFGFGASEQTIDFAKAVQKTKDKAFGRGIFNVIQFPNSGCAGDSGRNGTCYTSDECATKGGTSDGTCANGYGVCCVLKISCGQSSSENSTYLIVGPTTAPVQSCIFTLCRSDSSICRIRLDFNTFDINGPIVGTSQLAALTQNTFMGNSIGDCAVDSFSVSSPGNVATPVICGFNTKQHLYIDASSQCAKAAFNFGTGTYNRQADIKVTQYVCGDEVGGPEDCFQYYTSETGTIMSFNYKTTGGVVDTGVTHLSNQLYDICFRRSSGKCGLCFQPTTLTGVQSSFGLSVTNAAPPVSNTDTLCASDYLVIPNGVDATPLTPVAVISPAMVVLSSGTTYRGKDRFCGRIFSSSNGDSAGKTVCTARRPFRVTFRTDGDELTGGIDQKTDETFGAPGGIIGFSLDYWQISC